MDPRRVLVLALFTQALLAALAFGAQRALGVVVEWGDPVRDVPIGVAGAVVLAVGNYLVLVHAPGGRLIDGIRGVYREVLVPLFGRLDRASIVVIAVAAGIAEEWFFRGIVQALVGWVVGSVVFGLAHVGGRQMLGFGLWATVMGLALGGLAILTGGLLAPVVAHGLYDALALEYIRRTSAPAAGGFHQE